MTVVDAEGKILGRLASAVADRAMDGENVEVVNSEKAVISGKKEKVFEKYKQKYDRGSRDRGPFFPKRPDRILKRTVENMVSDDAVSNIKTYLGVPEDLEPEALDVKEGDDLKNRNYVKLGEVSRHVGWTE